MTTHLRLLACTATIAAAILTSCGNGADSHVGAGGSTATSTGTTSTTASTTASTTGNTAAAAGPDYAGPTIPAGLYTRHMTPQEARMNAQRVGLPRKDVKGALGPATQDLAFSFKVGDGVWAQYSAFDGGEAELGDSGTFTYDADGNWSTVSNSTGCPGCVLVYRWSMTGSGLTLTTEPGYDEDPIARFVTEGTYQRES